jgi:hypothetical protein
MDQLDLSAGYVLLYGLPSLLVLFFFDTWKYYMSLAYTAILVSANLSILIQMLMDGTRKKSKLTLVEWIYTCLAVTAINIATPPAVLSANMFGCANFAVPMLYVNGIHCIVLILRAKQ